MSVPARGSRPILLVVLLAQAGALACGGGDGTGPPDPQDPSVVAAVEVSPSPASVLVGGTLQLTAVAVDAEGATVSGRQVTWATSAGGIATVSPAGLVTGVAPGTATITATSDGIEGTTEVTVLAATGMIRTWKGGASGKASDWSTAANWTPAGRPIATDTVRVPESTHPAVLSEDVVVSKLIVAGGQVRAAGRRLVVQASQR